MSNELYGYFGKITDKSTGAKLYQELQKLKTKFTVGKDLSTVQLAKIIDSAGAKTDTLARLEKWFKTPKGKLAKQDELASFAPKAAAATTSSPTAGLTFGTGDISGVPSHIVQDAYSKIKAQGITLPSPGESIYDALVKIKSDPTYAGYDLLQLVRMLDAGSAKNFGVVDAHMYEQKFMQWLKTPAAEAKILGKRAVNTEIGRVTTPTRFTSITRNISQTDTVFDQITPSDALAWRSRTRPWTPGEKSAIYEYTRSSAPFNDPLRSETVETASSAVQKRIRNAQNAMRPSDRPILLVRGTGPDQFGFPKFTTTLADLQSVVGETFEDRGFVSTSITNPFSDIVRLEIEAPTGTPMSYVVGNSKYNNEDEMLLAAGARYRVMSVVESSPGRFTVRVRIIG